MFCAFLRLFDSVNAELTSVTSYTDWALQGGRNIFRRQEKNKKPDHASKSRVARPFFSFGPFLKSLQQKLELRKKQRRSLILFLTCELYRNFRTTPKKVFQSNGVRAGTKERKNRTARRMRKRWRKQRPHHVLDRKARDVLMNVSMNESGRSAVPSKGK